jgi:acyl carrier protein
VREALVVARESEQGDKRLVAYVIPTSDERPTTSNEDPASSFMAYRSSLQGELRAFLKATLPDYMVPSVFVLLERLPLSPNGKVDRKALPTQEGSRAEPGGRFEAPRTPVEETVAGLVAQVLGIERVGIHDNFFDLGGHSLLATKMVSRLRETFAIDLPLRSLFESPTVAGLAEHVEAVQWAAQETLVLPDNTEEDRQEGEL